MTLTELETLSKGDRVRSNVEGDEFTVVGVNRTHRGRRIIHLENDAGRAWIDAEGMGVWDVIEWNPNAPELPALK